MASDPSSGIALEYASILGIDPATGQLDAGFGDAGVRIVAFDVGESIGQFIGKDVIVRHNGRIVVLGDYWHDINGMVNPEVALIQLGAAGDLDAGFGSAGVATNLPGYTVETLALAERPGAGDLVVTLQADGLLPGDSNRSPAGAARRQRERPRRAFRDRTDLPFQRHQYRAACASGRRARRCARTAA